MKFHNITSVGKFILQKLASLPTFSVSDEGRIVYNTTNKKPYIATDEDYKKIGGGIGDLNTFTAGATLYDGYLYSINTSSAPSSGYLDSAPNSGDLISVYDQYDTFTTNNFIVYGNGNTINGNSSKTLTEDGNITSFIFDGNEWKVSVSSSSSATPSGNFDFDAITEVTTMDSTDKFLILDSTDGLNKKLSLTNWFSNSNIDTNLDVLGSAASNDYFIIYDTDAGITKKILVSNIIPTSRLDIKANDMFLDDTLTGSTFGSVFGVYKTIDFATTIDGSCWLSGKFPTNWSTSTDLQININYSLNGNDPGKTVRMNVDFWSVSETDTPTSVTSDITITNDITTSSTNINKYTEDTLTAIGNVYIESGIKSFVIKLTRDISEDTYSGSLQLISVDIYQ